MGKKEILSDIEGALSGQPPEGQKPLEAEEFKVGDRNAKKVRLQALHEKAVKSGNEPEEILELTEEVKEDELPAASERMDVKPIAETVEKELLDKQAKADAERVRQERWEQAWGAIAKQFKNLAETLQAMRRANMKAEVPTATYADMAKRVINQLAEENPGIVEKIVKFGERAGAHESHYDKGLQSVADSLAMDFSGAVKAALTESKGKQLDLDKWLGFMRQTAKSWLIKEQADPPRTKQDNVRQIPNRRSHSNDRPSQRPDHRLAA